MVGCFGGMSLAAALCTELVMTRQARLGMNGPEVTSRKRASRNWTRAIGGEERVAVGLANALSASSSDPQTGPGRASDGEHARFIAVVHDAHNRFPRATDNVVGLEQGWLLARAVREVIDADHDAPKKRPIVAVVDVKSQAYGRREELLGIHLAYAAVDAYASARLAGHPVIALIVGPAMSGAYLAHGYPHGY